MTDKKPEMFWLVWDATEGAPIESFDDQDKAWKFAKQKAEERLGSTIVVLEPKEAWIAAAVVSKTYLSYPARAAEPPPADCPNT